MGTVHTEVSAVIDAPPAEVYAVFADYHHSHQQVLPKPYFGELVVEKGGKGAGTVFRTSITMMGQTTNYTIEVTEPEPGRRIVETDAKVGRGDFLYHRPVGGGQEEPCDSRHGLDAALGDHGLARKALDTGTYAEALYN
jgi:hypothetical protein